MKVSAINSQPLLNNMETISKNNILSKPPQNNDMPGFQERLVSGLENVAKSQNNAAELAKNFEIGAENDLAKVMVGQQVSSIAFQLTLNVRNKALSAYKDIMNMPV
tara:strand:- start:223 stop:540 length:318 start_codon:yes stop_codon:yes gene_type:complete